MQLVRKVCSFGVPLNEKLDIYKKFVRTHLEQSCTVWNSGLSKGNENDIERVQKCVLKLILKHKYKSYKNALETVNIQTLKNRRDILCAKFAHRSLRNEKTKHMFKPNIKRHHMKTRQKEKFKKTYAKSERLKRSAIPTMEKLLNKHNEDKEKMSHL